MDSWIEATDSYAMLAVHLEPGEVIQAEPGAMVALSGVSMKTGSAGGLFSGFRRKLAGESFFINTFTGDAGGGRVYLAAGSPGGIGEFEVEEGRELYIQSSSFLACTGGVKTDSQFQGLKSMFSGESAFFLRVFVEEGFGTVYYNAYGALKRLEVVQGEELVVDTGHLVAFSDDVSYRIDKVGGLRSLVGGGEGLVMKFSGSGEVWIQTRNLRSLADQLVPFLPLGERKVRS